MLVLILILTVSCVVVSLLIALLALLERSKSRSKIIMVAMLVSLSGFYILELPDELSRPYIYEFLSRFIAIPSLGLIWWFALSILDDDFRLGKFAWLGMIALSADYVLDWALMVSNQTAPIGLDSILVTIFVAAQVFIVLHVLWVAAKGFNDDLLDTRRTARVLISVLPTIGLAINLAANYSALEHVEQTLLCVVVALPSTLVIMLWLMRFEASALNFESRKRQETSKVQINPRDVHVYDRLLNLMEREQAFLNPDLTIAKLAEQVGVPSHQLRMIINSGMGFRNFSAFLASYRIPIAKHMLATPEKARTPILSIAFESGFSSLPTFNRVFRAEAGMSAGAYRKIALEEVAQS